jgi:hypothetical protein
VVVATATLIFRVLGEFDEVSDAWTQANASTRNDIGVSFRLLVMQSCDTLVGYCMHRVSALNEGPNPFLSACDFEEFTSGSHAKEARRQPMRR